MNVKFHKNCDYTGKIQKISCERCHFVKFDICFLGLSWKVFFGVITDDLLHLMPLKNVRKNAICFKLLWYKIFVHWKSKLLDVPVDSLLIFMIDPLFYLAVIFLGEMWLQLWLEFKGLIQIFSFIFIQLPKYYKHWGKIGKVKIVTLV